MALKLYNTLSRKKEIFKPLEAGVVKYYTCGPTVYWFQHLGNLRTYVLEDSFKMLLQHEGFKVLHVRNYTDVGHLTSDADEGEDKMEVAARKEGKSPEEIADFYIKDFEESEKILGNSEPNFKCKATGHIKEMLALIKMLESKGLTYNTSQGVFYDTAKFKDYGKMAKLDIKGQLEGVREEVVKDSEKRNPSDFALWFINKPNHLLQWESPWGKGYPGWHIECSAMAMKYLGERIDIHAGGKEHIPVHHTNEIAQSEGASGKKFVNYWMHYDWLMLGEGKIAKSSGATLTVKSLAEKGFSGKQIRYFLLSSAHYRSKAYYTPENFQKAVDQLKRINEFVQRLFSAGSGKQFFAAKAKAAEEKFFKCIEDDFNVPMALNSLFEFIKTANSAIDSGKFGKEDAEKALEFLKEADSVLKVMDFGKQEIEIPAAVQRLLQEREKARSSKDWKKADELRDKIKAAGFAVLDTPEGQKLRKAE